MVQKSYPELLSIINKGINLITEAEEASINAKWATTTVNDEIDYALIAKIVFGLFLILAFLLYRNSRLRQYNEKIGRLKERLELALIGNQDGLWDRDFTNNESI